ncbi:MAG: hypothetical protein KatS3mg110_3343 [Pirellulaceae bacterium]|nr:MAG: hypothetical protein KatS3mg110_3343 [Pirellulaceae bacterium]
MAYGVPLYGGGQVPPGKALAGHHISIPDWTPARLAEFGSPLPALAAALAGTRSHPPVELTSVLEPAERVLGRVFAGDHFVGSRLALHRVTDCQLRRFIIVFVNLLVILGGRVDEHTADDT